MNEQNTTQLRDLEPVDRFYAASSRNKLPTFTVKTECLYDSVVDMGARICIIDNSDVEVSKPCNLKVVKL